jgi:hypothetical protein
VTFSSLRSLEEDEEPRSQDGQGIAGARRGTCLDQTCLPYMYVFVVDYDEARIMVASVFGRAALCLRLVRWLSLRSSGARGRARARARAMPAVLVSSLLYWHHSETYFPHGLILEGYSCQRKGWHLIHLPSGVQAEHGRRRAAPPITSRSGIVGVADVAGQPAPLQQVLTVIREDRSLLQGIWGAVSQLMRAVYAAGLLSAM